MTDNQKLRDAVNDAFVLQGTVDFLEGEIEALKIKMSAGIKEQLSKKNSIEAKRASIAKLEEELNALNITLTETSNTVKADTATLQLKEDSLAKTKADLEAKLNELKEAGVNLPMGKESGNKSVRI